MDVIEMTRQLGKAIQEDPTYIKYNLCKEKNDEDKELQELIGEFNLHRMTLNNEIGKEEKDEEKVKGLNERMRDCYGRIMQNPTMAAFNDAKAEMDALIGKVTGIISLCVDGENPETCEPSSCSGGCESCGGCH